MTEPLGVGFLGAGMATQAMHVPALATMPDRFRIVHVMDADRPLATAVAARFGAAASARVDDLLADPAVDVVAVCSPDRFHAEQVVAACEAGKRAVLCEKPLAVTREQGWSILEASTRTGVPVVVGTMHAYDPAYAAAAAAWAESGERAVAARSVIWLPSVDDQVAWSTERLSSGYVSFAPSAEPLPPADDARLLRTTVLDLAVHAIPLLRRLLGGTPEVCFARTRMPFGYVLSLSEGDRLVQLIAMMWGHWSPQWTLDVWGIGSALHVSFPPSYVLAGSAEATLTGPSGRRSWRCGHNGYQAEWEHVAAVVRDGADPEAVRAAVDDLEWVLAIADAAVAA